MIGKAEGSRKVLCENLEELLPVLEPTPVRHGHPVAPDVAHASGPAALTTREPLAVLRPFIRQRAQLRVLVEAFEDLLQCIVVVDIGRVAVPQRGAVDGAPVRLSNGRAGSFDLRHARQVVRLHFRIRLYVAVVRQETPLCLPAEAIGGVIPAGV